VETRPKPRVHGNSFELGGAFAPLSPYTIPCFCFPINTYIHREKVDNEAETQFRGELCVVMCVLDQELCNKDSSMKIIILQYRSCSVSV